MTWNTTKYEKAVNAYLIEELEEEGRELYCDYEHLRNELVKDNFFQDIKFKEPNLSDHSDRHIRDVQDRTFKLIGNFKERGLSGMDVYCLSLMILFHDVGNIFGRKGHDSICRIAEVYNKYRANHKNYGDERRQVSLGASAHSGFSSAGCKDTLKYLKKGSIKSEEINLPEIAAILRFADELSEGKHRTCSFLLERNLYEKDSQIFQEYAQITDIVIDRALERISITYNINVTDKFGEDKNEQKKIEDLIKFTFYRAIKLDQERRYTKNYSATLQVFKYVTVLYNFEKNYTPLVLDIQPIRFEDQYPVPGVDFVIDAQQAEQLLMKNNSIFKIEEIINLLRITKVESI
jgi:hypothetical protein